MITAKDAKKKTIKKKMESYHTFVKDYPEEADKIDACIETACKQGKDKADIDLAIPDECHKLLFRAYEAIGFSVEYLTVGYRHNELNIVRRYWFDWSKV